MKLSDSDRNTLVTLYLEKADDTWSELQVAIESEKWSMAANRMYYALFHAVTALLVKDGISVSSHLGAKIKFGQHYVKEGKVTQEQGHLYSQLESLRERADYDCFFKVEKDDVIQYYNLAEQLYHKLKELITSQSAN